MTQSDASTDGDSAASPKALLQMMADQLEAIIVRVAATLGELPDGAED